MNPVIDATVEFGVEQAKSRVRNSPENYMVADLHTVLLAQIRDSLLERKTWRRRVVMAIPWAGFSTFTGSLVVAVLKALE